MKLKIALGQINVREGDLDSNLAKANRFCGEGSKRVADLLLLPELWLNGFLLDQAYELAQCDDGPYFDRIRQLAETHKIAISGSVMRKTSEGKVRNSSFIQYADGQHSAFYDKLHLFEPMLEQTYLERGDRPVILNTQWGKIGLAICYDLRFPELFRHYAAQGVEIVLLSAQWPLPRIMHWKTLLRARAIENQMYIAACNRVGDIGTYRFFGASRVIGPTGKILLEMGDEEGLEVVEIDLALVEEVRNSMKVLDDIRTDKFPQS